MGEVKVHTVDERSFSKAVACARDEAIGELRVPLPSHDVTLTGRARVGNDVRGEQTMGMPQ